MAKTNSTTIWNKYIWNGLLLPFRYAIDHFKLAFASSPMTLGGRFKHLMWAIFELIPFLNYGILLFDRHSLHPAPQKNAETTRSEQVQNPIENPLTKKRTEAKTHMKEQRSRNPFFSVNAIRRTTQPHNAYESLETYSVEAYPLVAAVLQGDLTRVESIIAAPLYMGINEPLFYVKPGPGASFDSFPRRNVLEHAIATKNKALFHLILEKGRLVNLSRKAMLEAVKLGPEGEDYVLELLNRRSEPPNDEIIATARNKGLSQRFIELLQARKDLHAYDKDGLNTLHRACFDKQFETIKDLVEKKNFYLDQKTSDESISLLGSRNCSYIELITTYHKRGVPGNRQLEAAITEYLVDHGATCDTYIVRSLSLNDPSSKSLLSKIMAQGVNPCSGVPIAEILRGSDDYDAVRAQIDTMYPGSIQNQINELNICSLWGVTSHKANQWYNGGNFSELTYPLLQQTFNALQTAEFSDLLSQFPVNDVEEKSRILSQLAKSITYANALLKKKDFQGIASEIREKAQVFPVILPCSSSGHASAIIFWKNTIIQANRGANHFLKSESPGVTIYTYDPQKLEDDHIETILDQKQDATHRSILIDHFALNVDKQGHQKLHHIEMEGQRFGNCAWSSSAYLGFQVALEALLSKDVDQMTFAEASRRSFVDAFEALAQLMTVRKHLENLEQHQHDLRERVNTSLLKSIFHTCLGKLTEGSLLQTALFEKVIGELLASGHPIEFYEHDLGTALSSQQKGASDETRRDRIATIKSRFFSLIGVQDEISAKRVLEDAEGEWYLPAPGAF